jgi:hypothetical protein
VTDAARVLTRLQWPALAVGVAATVVCCLGGLLSPASFFRAWLPAYQFVLNLGLGCYAVLLVYHLTGGAWGFLTRRVLEAGTRTLPLLAVLFVPVALGAEYLFPWARPDEVAASEDLQHKTPYLNLPFFCVRAAVYFAIWLTVTALLNLWSRRQDRAGEPALQRRLGTLGGVGLALHGLCIHFASVDWLMSLEPAFRSTIIGPLMVSCQLLSAMAVAVIVLAWLAPRSPLEGQLSPEALNDVGNLLFAFLCVWGYLCYFQFMLIWIADLPHEVAWVQRRQSGVWLYVSWALIGLGFAAPFLLLLMRDVKRSPRALAAVAALILASQLVFAYREVLPAFEGGTVGWMDFVMPLGLGGLWLACFAWQLKWLPLVPAHDPAQATALHLRQLAAEEERRMEEMIHG